MNLTTDIWSGMNFQNLKSIGIKNDQIKVHGLNH